MNNSWYFQVWGVRGSFPAVGPDFLEFGGHTSCFSVDLGDAFVVLDAGSGLESLGAPLIQQGRRRVDLFISHLHLDHMMGLFPSPLLHNPQTTIHIYGSPSTLRDLSNLVKPPLWPVGLLDCQANVQLHVVWIGRPFPLAEGAAPGLTVTALRGTHPGGCIYYRLDREGHSLVYALDCELTGDTAQRVTQFAQGAGLLVWDASFTPGDLVPGWGHSTWEQGIALGRAAGARQVLMTHYSAGYTDEFLRQQEYLASQTGGPCCFAREGMVIEL